MSTDGTKDKILDAAERLFAEHGFAATSMRNLTAEAGVNLAAVHYHFGSKEALIEAVFQRRIGPLNRRRLDLLDAVERGAGDGPLPVEPIVEAFVGPALRMSRDPDQGGATFMRLLGHTFSAPSDPISRMFHAQFKEVAERFPRALARALPHLPAKEVPWRLLFMVGTMAHTMAICDKLPMLFPEMFEASDVEATMKRMVPFLVAGMQAPAPSGPPTGKASGTAGSRGAARRRRDARPTKRGASRSPASEREPA